MPVRMDLADMSHQMRWLNEHPEEAEKMAEHAARWTREFLSCLACLKFDKYQISVFLDFPNRFLLLQMYWLMYCTLSRDSPVTVAYELACHGRL